MYDFFVPGYSVLVGILLNLMELQVFPGPPRASRKELCMPGLQGKNGFLEPAPWFSWCEWLSAGTLLGPPDEEGVCLCSFLALEMRVRSR